MFCSSKISKASTNTADFRYAEHKIEVELYKVNLWWTRKYILSLYYLGRAFPRKLVMKKSKHCDDKACWLENPETVTKVN